MTKLFCFTMGNFLKCLLFFSLMLGAQTVCLGQTLSGSWVFLMPGQVHKGEAPSSLGQGWLALRKGVNGWELSPTKITLRRRKSEVADYDVEIKSNYRDAVALFKLPHLTAGRIDTPELPKGFLESFFVKIDDEYPTFKVTFNSVEYLFSGSKVQGAYSNREGQGVFSYDALVVGMGGRRSVVGDTGGDSSETDSSQNSVQIIWVGDIDSDGKLDVITRVNLSNASGLCLYLSSEAKGTELFGKSICHEGSGC